MNPLESLLGRFKGKRVVVVADLVADIFLHGEIARISREAPVLILNQRERRLVPGGGANAIHNLWALGGMPYPLGVVGDDADGEALVNYFARLGIDVSGIEKVPGYVTPAKTRILAEMPHGYRQQVVRVDKGQNQNDSRITKRIRARLHEAMGRADAVMISDYGYGIVLPVVLSALPQKDIPITLDSRFSVHQFTGMTVATPNESEVEAALGITIQNNLARLEKAGQALRKQLKAKALLITRGREGMALFEQGKKPVHIPIYGSDQVADVTGAGDTVIAVFTLALAAGGSFYDAARMANYAGGIVVMKYGTCTLSRKELQTAIHGNSNV